MWWRYLSQLVVAYGLVAFSLVTAYRGSRLRKRKGGAWGVLPLMSVKCGEYWCVAMLNSTTYYLFLDYVVALPFFTNLTFALVCC